jgi:hypothetical protein
MNKINIGLGFPVIEISYICGKFSKSQMGGVKGGGKENIEA